MHVSNYHVFKWLHPGKPFNSFPEIMRDMAAGCHDVARSPVIMSELRL
jgi:hypothetical protein